MAKMGRLRNGGTAAHWTAMFKSPRCTAKAKSTRQRCCNAAVKGWPVCRLHGARGGPKTPEGKAKVRMAATKHGMYAGPDHPTYGAAAGPLWPGHAKGRQELYKRLGIKAAPRGAIPPRDRTTGQFRPGSL